MLSLMQSEQKKLEREEIAEVMQVSASAEQSSDEGSLAVGAEMGRSVEEIEVDEAGREMRETALVSDCIGEAVEVVDTTKEMDEQMRETASAESSSNDGSLAVGAEIERSVKEIDMAVEEQMRETASAESSSDDGSLAVGAEMKRSSVEEIEMAVDEAGGEMRETAFVSDCIGAALTMGAALESDCIGEAVEIVDTTKEKEEQMWETASTESSSNDGSLAVGAEIERSVEEIEMAVDEAGGEMRETKDIVHQLRVSDLQQLLGDNNISRSGRKSELIERVLILVRQNISVLKYKVRDLHKKAQTEAEALKAAAEASTVIPTQQIQLPVLPPEPPVIARATPNMYQQQYANTVQNDNRSGQVHANGIVPIPYPETTPNPGYPIHPDVKLKKLAFFDVLATLLKPATLVPSNTTQRIQEGSFFFHLTPQQATDIATNRDIRNANKIEHTIQVQLRFCLLETSCEQEDYFPPNIVVKVNNKLCPLPNPIPTNKPGVEPKRPPRPVNITPNVKLSPLVANHIAVSWCTEYNRGYAAACYLVRKLTSSQLLQRMKTKGVKPADYTRALIKEKLNEDADCEIATTMLKVSLVCPLGKMRMATPCRSSTCSHLQCFDASLYLQMNERKPTWNCPVCDKPAIYDNLVIDGYFQEVLASNKLSGEDNEIQLHKDGSWSTHVKSNDTCSLDTPSKPVQKVEVISDDIEVITTDPPKSSINQASAISNTEPSSTTAPSNDTVDLTFSDSDDDLPLKRKTVTRTGGQSGICSNTGTVTTTSTTSTVSTITTANAKPTLNDEVIENDNAINEELMDSENN